MLGRGCIPLMRDQNGQEWGSLGKGQGIGVAWRQIWGGLGLAFMGEVSDRAVLGANQCLAWCRG